MRRNMSEQANYQRSLHYVPIIHSGEDMSIFRSRLPDPWAYSYGTLEYWRRLTDRIKGLALNWSTTKVYQDNLPDTDLGILPKIIEEIQSPNFELLRWMMGQGATVLGTESPALLKQEYNYLAAIFNGKESVTAQQARIEYARQAPALLKGRDLHIAQRINSTLGPEDVGVLFIGRAHRVDRELPKDILMVRIEVEPSYTRPSCWATSDKFPPGDI